MKADAGVALADDAGARVGQAVNAEGLRSLRPPVHSFDGSGRRAEALQRPGECTRSGLSCGAEEGGLCGEHLDRRGATVALDGRRALGHVRLAEGEISAGGGRRRNHLARHHACCAEGRRGTQLQEITPRLPRRIALRHRPVSSFQADDSRFHILDHASEVVHLLFELFSPAHANTPPYLLTGGLCRTGSRFAALPCFGARIACTGTCLTDSRGSAFLAPDWLIRWRSDDTAMPFSPPVK